MQKNIGTPDRIIRFILFVLIVFAAWRVDLLFLKIILGFIALFVLYEVLFSWCALYSLLGKNTCPTNLENPLKKNSNKKKILIVGAGPGGLSAGMILASRGYPVEIIERKDRVGGRNAPLKIGEFTFETGPTFILLPQVFETIFELVGKKLSDYLDFRKLDPMYRLKYKDGKNFYVYFDKNKLKEEIKKLFPGEEKNYDRWFKYHEKKFNCIYKCLEIPYHRFYHYFRWKVLRALPYFGLTESVADVLNKYFKTEEMRMAMAFQTKYLGMSPWECPGAFSILSYAEHGFGIYHAMGGVHKISEAMAKIFQEYGGKIRLNTEVKEIIVENKKARGVLLTNGEKLLADVVIMNADFAYGAKHFINEKHRPSYTDKKIDSLKYSCSTFMLYFAVDKIYDIPHHNIIFGKDYYLNVKEIFSDKGMPSDPAFYIQNPSVLDPSLAPKGKSTIYILVPVSNLDSKYPWQEKKRELRNFILEKIKERGELPDLEKHILDERMITPVDWQENMYVHKGSVFSIAHNVRQMLYMRPHNRFNDIPNLYLVGGGTHPGSGLPTILDSGRISAEMIMGEK
jgi:phytoene desaturase